MTVFTLRRLLLAVVVALAATFGGARAFAADAGRTPVPNPPKPAGAEKCVADTEFMRKNHMNMLMHQRDETMHEGVRTKQFSLANCFSCHVVKDEKGQAVAYSDPRHFCRSCHSYAAVRVDCFECHASRPDEKGKAADLGPNDAARVVGEAAAAALKAHVAEMKQ